MSILTAFFAGQFQKYGSGTITTLCLVYFAQGLKSLAYIARTLYFKNLFHFNASDLTIVGAVIYVSWYLKPIYGLISDCFPFFGYHRKSYLLATGVLGILSYLCLLFSNWASVSIIALIVGEVSQASADVLCDGLMVQKSKIDLENGANDLQRYSWISYIVGGIFGMALGGNTADYVNPRYVIALLAVRPLLVVISSISIDEEKVISTRTYGESWINFCNHLKLFWYAVKDPKVVKLMIFVVLWLSSLLTFNTIFEYYLYDVVLAYPSTISYAKLVGLIGMLLGTILGSNSLMKISIKNRLLVGRMIYVLLSLMQIIIWKRYYENIGVPYYWFYFFVSGATEFIRQLFCRLPLYIVFANCSPKHIEATFFALLASVNNFGMFLSEMIESGVMNATGLTTGLESNAWGLSIIAAAVAMVSLSLLLFIPSEIFERKCEENENSSDNTCDNCCDNPIQTPLIKNKEC